MSPAVRILTGLGLGLLAGTSLASFHVSPDSGLVATAEVIGGMWLDALRMTILPLVFALVVTGIASISGSAGGGSATRLSLALFALLLVAMAAMAATLVPLLLAIWPTPAPAAAAIREGLGAVAQPRDYPGILAMLRGLVPSNVVSSAAAGAILPVTFFALALGFALTKAEPETRTGLTAFFGWIKEAMLVIVGWVLKAAPVGVFALALVVGVRTGLTALGAFAHFIMLVVAMCLLATAAAYLVAMLLGRVPIARFARAAAPAQAIAISTQSSLASLPAMLKGSEGPLGIPRRITGLTLPLAVTLFRVAGPVATVTIGIYAAHVMNVPVGPSQLAAGAIVAVITVVAVGGGIPSQVVYFAAMTPILTAMGVPIEILALLIAVETIPDIFRTLANVSMDMAVTTAVARFSRTDEDELAPDVAVA